MGVVLVSQHIFVGVALSRNGPADLRCSNHIHRGSMQALRHQSLKFVDAWHGDGETQEAMCEKNSASSFCSK